MRNPRQRQNSRYNFLYARHKRRYGMSPPSDHCSGIPPHNSPHAGGTKSCRSCVLCEVSLQCCPRQTLTVHPSFVRSSRTTKELVKGFSSVGNEQIHEKHYGRMSSLTYSIYHTAVPVFLIVCESKSHRSSIYFEVFVLRARAKGFTQVIERTKGTCGCPEYTELLSRRLMCIALYIPLEFSAWSFCQ